MSRRLLFRPEAAEELADAYEWYEARVEGLGSEFVHAVDSCLASIERGPHVYPIVHKEIRRALLRNPVRHFLYFQRHRDSDLGLFPCPT